MEQLYYFLKMSSMSHQAYKTYCQLFEITLVYALFIILVTYLKYVEELNWKGNEILYKYIDLSGYWSFLE